MFSRPLIRSPDCGHSWTMFSADISYCAFPNFSRSPDSYTSRIRLAISSLFIAVPPALRRFALGEIIGGFRAAGLENLLALGGDPLPAEESYKELEYAWQLVELGRRLGFESIGVAAHPAGHPRSPDLRSDREHLAFKMRLADFAITQFFFKVEEYERLRDEMAALGITKPIIAGIMPITSLVSVQRMAELSGYAVPVDIVQRIEAGGDDRAEIRKRGIDVATELCRDLLEAGVPGLHFYTLNFSKATREIHASLGFVTHR